MEHLETRCLLSATVLSQVPIQSVPTSGTTTVNLETYFDDAAIPAGDTVVDIQTNMPGTTADIPVELTTNATPKTVANFLQYISSGEYANTIIHRSVPSWVIQGGGYDTSGNPITTFGNISGESATEVLSNTLGTLAMALSSGPDSGTSQWFINLGNNSSSLDGTADGGPFTVFGQVIYNGMTTVNAIAALTTVNANGNNSNGPFGNLPLQNAAGNLTASNLVVINPVVVPGGVNFTAVSGNTSLVTASVSNGNLTLTPAAGVTFGTTTITVTATDLGGGNVSQTFTVDVGVATPAFSNLSASSSIGYGTASVVFSGTIAAGAMIPPSTENVAVTLNGVTQDATIGANGNFTTTFTTNALPVSSTPYQVTYAYAGDANFHAITNNTTTQLTVLPGTASIAGTIYGDTSDSGVWKAGDPALNDVMVYLDSNNNGTLDAGEISVNTNTSGNYLFTDLPAGNYTVREVVPGGYVQTYPAAGNISLTLTTGQAVAGQTFLDAPNGNATAEAVYRLYSPVTLEHLYTTDPNEYNALESYVGTWSGEGQVFSEYSGNATVNGVADEPFYRLYNPFVKQHLWTTDLNEYTVLATEGWNQENIVGYVFPTAVPSMASCTPLYRLMAPQVHLWTTAVNEYDTLQTEGWTAEGIIGYVL